MPAVKRGHNGGWFTQVLLYMGKMIHEWLCEVVLKRMTQSCDSYVVIKYMLRHILGGSYNGGCAARRGQVTLYGNIWFMYAYMS